MGDDDILIVVALEMEISRSFEKIQLDNIDRCWRLTRLGPKKWGRV